MCQTVRGNQNCRIPTTATLFSPRHSFFLLLSLFSSSKKGGLPSLIPGKDSLKKERLSWHSVCVITKDFFITFILERQRRQSIHCTNTRNTITTESTVQYPLLCFVRPSVRPPIQTRYGFQIPPRNKHNKHNIINNKTQFTRYDDKCFIEIPTALSQRRGENLGRINETGIFP